MPDRHLLQHAYVCHTSIYKMHLWDMCKCVCIHWPLRYWVDFNTLQNTFRSMRSLLCKSSEYVTVIMMIGRRWRLDYYFFHIYLLFVCTRFICDEERLLFIGEYMFWSMFFSLFHIFFFIHWNFHYYHEFICRRLVNIHIRKWCLFPLSLSWNPRPFVVLLIPFSQFSVFILFRCFNHILTLFEAFVVFISTVHYALYFYRDK